MKTIALSILIAIAVGILLGFFVGTALAGAGITALGLYVGLVLTLYGCYFAATCAN